MALLSNSEFLEAAAKLFASAQETRSSLYITQKRLNVEDPVEDEDSKSQVSRFLSQPPLLAVSKITKPTKTYPILIRITDGAKDKSKKQKISTQVEPEHLSKFWREYSSVVKSGATGLKKKEKGKKKKKSAK